MEVIMDENEKKLLQAEHRLEEAEMRDRNATPERGGLFRRVQYLKRRFRLSRE
jgi:hypothetical protein